jgi:NTE family protein
MSRPLNIALQGGGAHGAFTWGVLDRLLEHGDFAIDGLSGTSAGAMNAVVLADGYMKGGREGAREALERFWLEMSADARFSPLQPGPIDQLLGQHNLDTSPTYLVLDVLQRFLSPYDTPLAANPLRDLVERMVDFERVRACDRLKLFVSATNVQTGKARVFRTPEITLDVVMASACLPFLFRAVEIDGVPYWDGGYGGNPALHPFFRGTRADDILIVQINPVFREETPRSAREILNRVNEITFNAALLAELRAIEFVDRLLAEKRLDGKRYKRPRLHLIAADGAFEGLNASSKLNASKPFLLHLMALGREAADAWLAGDAAKVGREPGLDLRALLGLTDPDAH